jgi:hypothetical protein
MVSVEGEIVNTLKKYKIKKNKMKKVLLGLVLVLMSYVSYGQKYVSKKQHINTINNQYMLGQVNTYFIIEGDKILNTDKNGNKIFDQYIIGETKKGDMVIRYSLNTISEGTTGKIELVRKSLDTFTNKSSKIVYELTLVE